MNLMKKQRSVADQLMREWDRDCQKEDVRIALIFNGTTMHTAGRCFPRTRRQLYLLKDACDKGLVHLTEQGKIQVEKSIKRLGVSDLKVTIASQPWR